MNEINKNWLLDIGFDSKIRKPKIFSFYNEKAKRGYWGTRWKPNGESSAF